MGDQRTSERELRRAGKQFLDGFSRGVYPMGKQPLPDGTHHAVIVNTAKTAEESIGAGRGPRGQLSREGTPTTSREREERSGVGGDASRLPHRAGGTAMPAAAAADAASADRPTRERGSIARAKTEASSVDPWIYVYPWSRCPRAYDHRGVARKSGQNVHTNCMGKASRGAA
jgi:hypothetical protein